MFKTLTLNTLKATKIEAALEAFSSLNTEANKADNLTALSAPEGSEGRLFFLAAQSALLTEAAKQSVESLCCEIVRQLSATGYEAFLKAAESTARALGSARKGSGKTLSNKRSLVKSASEFGFRLPEAHEAFTAWAKEFSEAKKAAEKAEGSSTGSEEGSEEGSSEAAAAVPFNVQALAVLKALTTELTEGRALAADLLDAVQALAAALPVQTKKAAKKAA